jgi:hypothetical protein
MHNRRDAACRVGATPWTSRCAKVGSGVLHLVQPSAGRLRIWRALKSLGYGSMRDGVYVLPEAQAVLFDPLVTEVRAHGGQASVLELSTRDEAQRAEVLALEETEARRRWRSTAEALQTLRRIDYYPGAAAERAQAELDTLRQALDARFSRGEPVAQAPHGISRLDPRKFQGKSRASAGPRGRGLGWIGWPAPG